MTGKTHALIGLATTLAVHNAHPIVVEDPVLLALALAAGVVGALAPDIDSDESEIRQLTRTNRRAGLHGQLVSLLAPSHRGLTHSALAVLVLALAWLWWPWPLLFAFIVGYISHIAADMLTRSGVPVLWPLAFKWHLLPGFLRITTGTLPEGVLAIAVGVWVWQFGLPVLNIHLWPIEWLLRQLGI